MWKKRHYFSSNKTIKISSWKKKRYFFLLLLLLLPYLFQYLLCKRDWANKNNSKKLDKWRMSLLRFFFFRYENHILFGWPTKKKWKNKKRRKSTSLKLFKQKQQLQQYKCCFFFFENTFLSSWLNLVNFFSLSDKSIIDFWIFRL